MVGFRSTIPANTETEFTSTISDTQLTAKSTDGIKNIEIDEEANSYNLNVFPNPFNEFIYLEDINTIKSETVNLKISNSLGFCVFDKTYTTESLKNNSKIYLENLSSGVYFLNIKTGDKTIVKKIIKQ